MMYDTIIVGGGIAAFGAAVYCGRFQLKTLVLGKSIGGTIILTDDVSNYPGFKKLSGSDLFEKIKEHANDYKIETKTGRVTKISKTKNGFKVDTAEQHFESKTLIIATGSEWRKLNVPGEKEFANKGVHYCALCDGPVYKGKVLGVVGGSDSAAKEALLLTQYGSKVYIFYRGSKIHPEPVNMRKVEKNPKIEVIPNTNIVEIKGDKLVRFVVLDNLYKGTKEFKLDGLFIEIGHIPLSDIVKGLGVKLNEKGEIIIDRAAKTNVEGVYACGDIVDTVFKQAITGVAEGTLAAYSAYEYIETLT
ncbi:MAG TPA: FAD-dependent oxidoreductase [Candidatus Nanoarchaeia archaeon]|nr:FAD-dependent oxidoreductase [Candidatus Nanoarchaeia archaeon]